MKRILVLGAGKSSPYLIRYVLDEADANDWRVTVADLDVETARARVGDHPRGDAEPFDVTDAAERARAIGNADLVVNLLAPPFQPTIARDCVGHGAHMVSASYETPEIRALDTEARERGVLLLTEMGLDPGIDHMSTMALLESVATRGGEVVDFFSYGGGLPAPESPANPLRYVITWNPRNVVMAGAAGAQYKLDGQIKCVPYAQVFDRTWHVDVAGVGELEAYPNRDSLGYIEAFGLEHVRTMVRGTLRYPGFSDVWRQIVKLGLPNEDLVIPDMRARTYADVVEMFLPMVTTGPALEERVARFLGVSPTGHLIQTMRWLGLFSRERVRTEGTTAAAMMVDLLGDRLALAPDGRDMVILQHDLSVRYEDERTERIASTMVHTGEPGGFTAMARTVGQPAGIAVKLILTGVLDLVGRQIPTRREIYAPVLRELAASGIAFSERVAADK